MQCSKHEHALCQKDFQEAFPDGVLDEKGMQVLLPALLGREVAEREYVIFEHLLGLKRGSPITLEQYVGKLYGKGRYLEGSSPEPANGPAAEKNHINACEVFGGSPVGGNVCNPDAEVTPLGIVESLPLLQLGVVVVFDNKGKDDTAPRIGVVTRHTGESYVISKGNSPVLTSQDLECVQLVDPQANLYFATTSLGRMYTFTLVFSDGDLECVDVAQGQLPVPPNESTASWKDANRCNIEATWLMHDALSPTGKTVFWAGRGGDALSSWYKCAHYNPQTASVDEDSVIDGCVNNVLGNPDYRTISCMDGIAVNGGTGVQLFFASAYDGEEKGHDLDLANDQTDADNRRAFKSAIARTDWPSGETTVIARYEGAKIEAMQLIESGGKATGLALFSDDEGLGSLIGLLPLAEGSPPAGATTEFVDLAKNTSASTGVHKKKYGTSGASNACDATMALVKHKS